MHFPASTKHNLSELRESLAAKSRGMRFGNRNTNNISMNTQELMKGFMRASRENPLQTGSVRASGEFAKIVRKSKSRNRNNNSVVSNTSDRSNGSKFTKLGTRKIRLSNQAKVFAEKRAKMRSGAF